MTAIGIDTHKATLAACAVDELGRAIGEATFANDPAGHVAFIAWARSIASEATIGIEGSSSFGAPLAWAVHHAGLSVREVPPHLSRAERQRTRRPGKSDPGDALAIARVTARETNLPPIRLPDRTSELKLLLEAREDLVADTTRVRNRLHAHLLALVPGYGGTVARRMPRTVPAGGRLPLHFERGSREITRRRRTMAATGSSSSPYLRHTRRRRARLASSPGGQ
jgi:transposase